MLEELESTRLGFRRQTILYELHVCLNRPFTGMCKKRQTTMILRPGLACLEPSRVDADSTKDTGLSVYRMAFSVDPIIDQTL